MLAPPQAHNAKLATKSEPYPGRLGPPPAGSVIKAMREVETQGDSPAFTRRKRHVQHFLSPSCSFYVWTLRTASQRFPACICVQLTYPRDHRLQVVPLSFLFFTYLPNILPLAIFLPYRIQAFSNVQYLSWRIPTDHSPRRSPRVPSHAPAPQRQARSPNIGPSTMTPSAGPSAHTGRVTRPARKISSGPEPRYRQNYFA